MNWKDITTRFREGMTSFRHKLVAELLVWTAITPLAFFLRFDGAIPESAMSSMWWLTGISAVLKFLAIIWFQLNRQSWRKASVGDVERLLYAAGSGLLGQLALRTVLGSSLSVPRLVPFIEFAVGLLALAALRLLWRLWHARSDAAGFKGDVSRVLIIGAGEAGTMVAREMMRHPNMGLKPAGFLDDGKDKQRLVVEGARVLGDLNTIKQLTLGEDYDEVVLAIPTASGELIRRVRELCAEVGAPLRIMPGVFELLSETVSVSRLREVRIEDLLRREAVAIDLSAVRGYLEGKTVLVTGAGGSIGSELVRQILRCNAATVIALGRGENSIYTLLEEVNEKGVNPRVVPVITDVRDKDSLERVFTEFEPDVVFHAAAHKHVPLMEANPEQAVLNNLVGTQNLVEAAKRHGVKTLVNISTDKAVNPTSIMGATKRLAEQVVTAASDAEHKYVSVRFGNVLGSRGSVVPKFRAQIKAGGPVKVTHPDMVRYFMTIPEAVQLVLQAGALAEPKAVYYLDMGEPVRISQLAEDLISLSGLKPHVDIEVQFTGVRPGEKLFEELVVDSEQVTLTAHPKVFLARASQDPAAVSEVLASAQAGDREAIRAAVRRAVRFAEAPEDSANPTAAVT